MVLQSWFIVEIATVLQFLCARWLYLNRGDHVTRAAQLVFRSRMLPQPADHLALISGLVTRNTSLYEPLARLVAEYWTISSPYEPLDTMKDDVTFRLATQLWVKKDNVASSSSSGPGRSMSSNTMTYASSPSSLFPKSGLEPVEVFNASGWYPRTQLGTHIPLRLGALSTSWPRVRLPVRYLSRRHTMFAVGGRLRPCYVPDFGACQHTELARRNWADVHGLLNYWLTLPFTHAAIINAVDNARRHLLPPSSSSSSSFNSIASYQSGLGTITGQGAVGIAAAAAALSSSTTYQSMTGNGFPLPLVNDDTHDIVPPADFIDVPLSLVIEVRPLPWPLHGSVEFAYHGVAVEVRTCCSPPLATLPASYSCLNNPSSSSSSSSSTSIWEIDSARRRSQPTIAG
jgi:hypothetical protein